MKLLIADEDMDTRHLIIRSLTESAIEITCETRGDEAWKVLSAPNAPRLVILDWLLPEMSALEICRKVRDRSSAHYTHIIMLAGRAAKARAATAFEAGADDFAAKPIDGDEIFGRIRSGWRALEKEDQLTEIIRGWRTMLDSLPFGVACLGSRGQLLRANKIFVELVQFELKSLLGKPVRQTVLPDARNFSHLMTHIRTAEAFDRSEMEMLQGDGSRRRVIVWGRPIPTPHEMVYQIITSVP